MDLMLIVMSFVMIFIILYLVKDRCMKEEFRFGRMRGIGDRARTAVMQARNRQNEREKANIRNKIRSHRAKCLSACSQAFPDNVI